jgi:chromosome segregation protein
LYLKRLEIIGFKSFADKIKLEFLPGVTAIVGPNGSGKSNISDALRWVLGEQSIKNLRGAKMDDVIFAGSAQRKPLGLAEVTIVLDNSDHSIPVDFTEIAVTRKLFRSGESDYLINKSSVRLRDILELFYDTGLGKEAYSVIGQGKIDSILSVKPEERRNIFEEAAGIIKYKTRKQVAERKLEETDHNLLRLQDILTELGAQLGPLETQSNTAQSYLHFKEELSRLEINHFGGLIKNHQIKLEELDKAKKEIEQQYQDFEGQESIIESELEKNRLQSLNYDSRITELSEDFYRIQNQIDKCTEQIGFLQNKLSDMDEQEKEYRNNKNANLSRKETIFKEQSLINGEIEAIKEKLGNDEQALQQIEKELAAQNQELLQFEAQEQGLKDSIIETLNEIAALKNKINTNNLQKEFILKQVSDFEKKISTIQNQSKEFEEDLATKKQQLENILSEIQHEHNLQSEITSQLRAKENDLNACENRNLELKEKIRGLESKHSLLDEMERSYQGYFQGVKALLAEAVDQPFFHSIQGIVADLIKVQAGMELAIETALGSSLQNVVIDDDRHAQEAIAYLKRYSKGRATFLPLNTIDANDSKMQQYHNLLQQYGCQPAISMLEFDPKYRQALIYMLHQTVVAPDLKTAVQISSKLDRSFRIVTPEGDLVNPGGSITGGSIDKRRLGLLSRRREIEDLKQEKNEAEMNLAKGLQNAKDLKNQFIQLTHDLEAAKKHEQEGIIRKASIDRELQIIGNSMARANQEITALADERNELTVQLEHFNSDFQELSVSVEAKETQLHQIEEHLTGFNEEMRHSKQSKDNLIERISDVKSRLSAAYQEENGKVALKERLQRQIMEIDDLDNDFELRQQQLESEKVKIREQISGLEARIVEEKNRLGSQESLVAQTKLEKEQILFVIKDLEAKERNFRRKNNEFQNQLHKYDLSISQSTLELENLLNNLKEDYGSDWMTQVDPEWTSPPNVMDLIEQNKEELRKLGSVNLGAIEDYRQVKERFDFLTNQSQDLTHAKESLLKVIAEIESTIVKRFNETFQEVKIQFKKLFAELFEGGVADLFLLDPDNPLDSGIEIVAQPPGKKLQSLSLLSGGERAMTAIALLFSILAVKPSPFCVLDEIDAALDEVNVSRFSHLLEMFSKQLQFIVVTHRRGTMEAASTLYGVTMEEMGVTKLISLDLNQVAQKAG